MDIGKSVFLEILSHGDKLVILGHNLRKQGQAGDKTAATRAANNTGVSLESSRTNRGKIVRKKQHQRTAPRKHGSEQNSRQQSIEKQLGQPRNQPDQQGQKRPKKHYCLKSIAKLDYWSMQSEKRPVRVWPGGLYLIRSWSGVFEIIDIFLPKSAVDICSRHPTLKWAQRDDLVYITIDLPDAKNVNLKLTPEGKFYFSATSGPDSTPYEIDINLYDNVNVDESKANVGSRNVVYIVKKEESKWWNRLLKQEGRTPAFVKVDWNKWVDEDEQDEKAGPDMDYDDVNFSSLNLGGGGGEDFDADDDDDDEE
ncbi:hypothetical protein LXL04_029347 [Taraxacum kok-saghyz]